MLNAACGAEYGLALSLTDEQSPGANQEVGACWVRQSFDWR